MNIWILLITILLGLVMVGGIILSLINLPGVAVIYGAVFISAFIFKLEVITVSHLVWMGIITFLSVLVDNVTVAVGAKKFGASKWGILGAFIGGIVGVIVGNIIGAIVGPFIGAALFELLLAGKAKKEALKAGFGSFLGFLAAVVIRFGIAIGMFITWLTLIIRHF